MLEGKCPKCGARYCGWSLNQQRYQMCGGCGTGLEITDDNGRTFTGYSPFSAEEYIIKTRQDMPGSEKRKIS